MTLKAKWRAGVVGVGLIAIGCGPQISGADGAETEAADDPDPRIELTGMDYTFVESCGYRSETTNIRIRLTATDRRIDKEDLEVTEYVVEGYMSGESVFVSQADEDEFPVEVGRTAVISLHDTSEGGGDCASFDPPQREVPASVTFALHADIIEIAGTASLGCGWDEC